MHVVQMAHAGESHQSSGQSFFHVLAAWYILVPVFTIAITLIVALAIRHLLDKYEADHHKHVKKSAKQPTKT